MTFPDQQKVLNLLKGHPEYDEPCNIPGPGMSGLKQVDRLAYYYEGGDAFPIKTELRWKPIELSSHTQLGQAMRTGRCSAAFYNNYFEDTINDLVSQLCKDPLTIEYVSDSEPTDDYWEDFQDCVDGAYGTATSVTRKALTQDMIFNRAFYLVRFPDVDGGQTLQTQVDEGEARAQIIALDSQKITDWRLDDNGQGLVMARMYEIELIQNPVTGLYDTEQHKWTYYTADAIDVYIARKKPADNWGPKDFAVLQEPKMHEFGRCPVFMVVRKVKAAVGKKLLPTARQLFNEESDASFYRMTTITGSLFVFSATPGRFKRGIPLTPFGAPIFGEKDKVDRDKVDPAAIQALDAASANRRGQMRGLIHELARQGSSQSASGQNTSRMPAARAAVDNDPLGCWLLTFREGHVATWRQMIAAICDVRGEDDDLIQIGGLMGAMDEEDDGVTTDQMTAEKVFQELPYVPDEAKQERGKAIGIRANPGVDEKTLKKISKLKKPEKPQTPADNKNGDEPPGIKSGKLPRIQYANE